MACAGSKGNTAGILVKQDWFPLLQDWFLLLLGLHQECRLIARYKETYAVFSRVADAGNRRSKKNDARCPGAAFFGRASAITAFDKQRLAPRFAVVRESTQTSMQPPQF